MPSILGHRFSVPETVTLPVRGASRQVRATGTAVVMPAVTLNVAEPVQVALPSAVVAVMVIWKPLPAGRLPMVALSVVDDDTSMVPVRLKPFGPVMVKLAELICRPSPSCSAKLIEPVDSRLSTPVGLPAARQQPGVAENPNRARASIVILPTVLVIALPPKRC